MGKEEEDEADEVSLRLASVQISSPSSPSSLSSTKGGLSKVASSRSGGRSLDNLHFSSSGQTKKIPLLATSARGAPPGMPKGATPVRSSMGSVCQSTSAHSRSRDS